MNNELYIIDLVDCVNTGEIINNVSAIFELPDTKERKMSLKLGDIALNQSQVISIQSLIASYGSELSHIETSNKLTAETCSNMGIEVDLKEIEEKPFMENTSAENISYDLSDDTKNAYDTSSFRFETEFAKDEVFPEFKVQEAEDDIEKNETTLPVENEFNEIEKNEPSVQIEENKEEVQKEEIQDKKDDFEHFEEIKLENPYEKQVMDTYKKAYDENEEDKETWEEVDYYAPSTVIPVVADSKQTIYVTQTLRSGQVLEFDGNVVVIGDCHPGSEIKATGDITVWGVLGSIAHAGMKGNREAKIRALKMNAVQLRIANCYSRRPDGTNIPYIIKSSTFTPEEARIVDDSIVLFKIIN